MTLNQNQFFAKYKRKSWTWAIHILESPLATSNELEDAESSSLFQKSKEVTTLQLSDFIFDHEK